MKEMKGNLWDFHSQGKWVCVTTNGTVKSDGSLIMGAGCAGEAARRYPGLPIMLGVLVSSLGNNCYSSPYKIISFPTIENLYKDSSTVERVLKSAFQLKDLVHMYNIPEIYIPRPGCGLGGLNWDTQVKPILEKVFTDDNFIVITF